MENTLTHSFLFGFPNQQSDILMHITQWQYWFWFWFTYFLVLYYFLFLRLIRYRNLAFSPKLATTFRSHGKWGDLIVCLLPISWCVNILSNSNFILRMIEWQSESSLFTLRIRGKQWYWVYKFELKVFENILNTPKNIGTNFWSFNNNLKNNNLLFFIKQKHDLNFNNLNWTQSLNNNINSNYAVNFNTKLTTISSNNLNNTNDLVFNSWTPSNKNYTPNLFYKNMSMSLRNLYVFNKFSSFKSFDQSKFNSNKFNSLLVDDITRINKKIDKKNNFYRLIISNNSEKLVCKFNSNNVFVKKPFTNNLFLVIKQKRFSTPSYNSSKNIINDVNFSFKNNNLKHLNVYLNENRKHSVYTSTSTNKRLLRTKRILVLPSHVNITLITNSFDVMHSWFIPGLGLKLDCVPGRSTHHVIYIDHVGFYYGQCAEICGRYHHHMPIRLCALPFEHFLLWWYHYGSPFFLAANQDRSKYIVNSSKLINW